MYACCKLIMLYWGSLTSEVRKNSLTFNKLIMKIEHQQAITYIFYVFWKIQFLLLWQQIYKKRQFFFRIPYIKTLKYNLCKYLLLLKCEFKYIVKLNVLKTSIFSIKGYSIRSPLTWIEALISYKRNEIERNDNNNCIL